MTKAWWWNYGKQLLTSTNSSSSHNNEIMNKFWTSDFVLKKILVPIFHACFHGLGNMSNLLLELNLDSDDYHDENYIALNTMQDNL